MYSPRIRDDLIPRLYHAAREAGVAMTTWVNQALETALATPRQTGGEEGKMTLNEKPLNSNRSTPRGGQQP